MTKLFNTKTTLMVTALSAAFLMSGCTEETADTVDTSETNKVAAPATHNTMDVKQPSAVTEAPKATLQPAPVEKKAEAVVAQAAVAPSGEKAFATCVGCHGAHAEGGVGPRLNNQAPDDIVAKLEKYKAGEQLGPMTGMMAPMAAGLSSEDMKAIAGYVVTLK